MLFKKKNPGEEPISDMAENQNVKIEETVGEQVLSTGMMNGDAVPEWSIGSSAVPMESPKEMEIPQTEPIQPVIKEFKIENSQAVYQTAPQAAYQATPQVMPQPTPQAMPQPTPQVSPQAETYNSMPLDELPLDNSASVSELPLDSISLDNISADSISLDNATLGNDTLSFDNAVLGGITQPAEEKDSQLDLLLERLDMSESIKRMNEIAQEDIADVIERDESVEELLAAKPADELSESFLSLDSEPSVPTDELSLDSEPSAPTDELSLDSVPSMSTDEFSLDSVPSVPTDELSLDSVPPVSTDELSLDSVPSVSTDELSLDSVTEAPVDESMFQFEPEQPQSVEPVEPAPLPKYVKPDFDMEPISQPLVDSDAGGISEYDTVPTVSDLEEKWSMDSNIPDPAPKPKAEKEGVMVDYEQNQKKKAEKESGFAFSLDDVEKAAEDNTAAAMETSESPSENVSEHTVYTEDVYKKTGAGKRLYHKILLS